MSPTASELAAMSCGAAMPPALVELEATVIAWCASLGQVIHAPGGFVAWFRVAPEHVDLVAAGDFAAVTALPPALLTGGPVLVIADAAGKGLAARIVMQLCRLPGVEEVIAFRRGRLRRHRRAASCRG